MTPLHWAAYQGDEELVQILLDYGAIQSLTTLDNAPVDIAGFCKHQDVVMTFCQDMEKKFTKENVSIGNSKDDVVVDIETANGPS